MRHLPFLAVSVLSLSASLLACGGSADQTPDAADSGPAVSDATAPSPDAQGADAGRDADASPTSSDDSSAPEDAAVPPDDANPSEDAGPADANANLFAGAAAPDAGPPVGVAANLVGWTTDERLVYRTNDAIFALGPDGGIDTVITAASADAGLSGAIGTNGVFVTQGSALGIWTKASGYHALGTDLLTAQPPVQSADGEKALYFVTIDGGAGTSTAVAQNVDGTDPRELSFVPSPSWELTPQYQLTSSDGVAVAAEVTLDGGTAAPGLDLFAGSAPSLVAQLRGTWVTDPAGASAFVVDPSGNATLVRLSDGSVTAVDTGVASGIFDPTGAEVYYVKGAALEKVAVASPGTTSMVVASGVVSVVAVSPDGQFVEYANDTDYFVMPTSGVGTPLAAGTSTIGFFSGFFTPDSTYVVSLVGSGYLGSYDVVATPVSGSGKTTTWTAYYFVPMFDSRLLLLDEYSNLFLADVSGKRASKLFATNVYEFAESWDNEQVAWQLQGETGVYLTQAQ